jgi:hypothetical protein
MRDRLRALWRAARDRRGLRRMAAVVDRLRWARTIRAAGVTDADYVSAQLGHRVSEREAVRRYVRRGFQTGLRLNPLFVDVAVGDHLPQTGRVPALYAYLRNDPRGVRVSPLWDAAAYLRAHPERADEPGGAVGAVWRQREAEPPPFDPAGAGAPPSWRELHAVVVDAATAARSGDASAAGTPADADVEVVAAIEEGERDFDESLAELADAHTDGAAVAIAVTSSDPEIWAQIALLCAVRPGVRALLRPGATPAEATSELLASTRADVVVVRGPNQSLSVDAVRTLATAAADGAVVAPLWLDADGTIAAVGAARDGRILAGHPAEDAAGLGEDGVVEVPVLAGTTFASRAALLPDRLRDGEAAAWASVHARADGAPSRVRTDATARSRVPAPAEALPLVAESADPQLARAGWMPVDAGPHPRRRRAPRTAVLADGREVPVLRWALRTAAPAGPRAEWWGDTHFARGLADALRRLGQEAVVDAYPARDRRTTHLDDVTVVLRGPERIDPPATGVSVLWVISHPDQIDAGALEGFDLVFAASAPWARAAAARFGRDIRPLLQCTDTTRFRPAGLPRDRDVVFVGTARGIERPSILAPVRAGIPIRVYGPDWREWIPARAIAGTGIPNAELPAVYESAGAVLNDHWPAMQAQGFIANRPYDVVAAGGRVVSDHVEGIVELFEGAVVTYRDTDELLALLRGDLDAAFPGEAELARISARVRERDSFDARARTLLDAVVAAG